MARPTSPAQQPLVQQPEELTTLTSGPWVGVRDTVDSSTAASQYLTGAQNMYRDPQYGSWLARPGSKVLGSSGAGTQLGSAGVRRNQGFGQVTFYSNTGTITRVTVVVCGGKFYTYNWSNDTFTNTLTAANLAAASVTLDTTARVYFAVLANKLIVSDGTNTPWMWDGTAGGGITKLTNCPVLFGQPQIYYAKLVAPKALNRVRFVWSEENDPTIGYETAPYNNYWDFTQVDANVLVGLMATNDVLNVYRERSAASITGRVDTQFSTTGVRGNVGVGTPASSALVYHENSSRIVFMDIEGKVHLQTGNEVEDVVWRDSRQTLATLSKGLLNQVIGVNYTPAELIIFGVPEVGQSELSAMMVFAIADSLQFLGTWRGWGTFVTLGMVADQNGVPYLWRGDDNGYVYQHMGPDDGQLNDVIVGGTSQPITAWLKPQYLGATASTEWSFLRNDIVGRALGQMTVSVQYTTPRVTSAAQVVTIGSPAGIWDQSLWDTGVWAGVSVDLHKAVGWNANGRWIQPIYTHATASEPFGIQMITVDAKPITRQPGTA